MEAVRSTLLDAAKAFIRRSTRSNVIAPLAAVTLATAAQAQVVLNLPTGASYSGGSVPGGDYFATQLGAFNNITGVRYGISSITLNGDAGGGPPYQTFFLDSSPGWSGSIPAGTTVPIAYSFTLGQSGSLAITNWSLTFRFSPESATTVASGSGAGPFSGSYNYVVGGSPLSGGFYESSLEVNFTGSGQLSLSMNSGSGGISVNAIPEPGTYGMLAGVMTLVFALRRRRDLLAS